MWNIHYIFYYRIICNYRHGRDNKEWKHLYLGRDYTEESNEDRCTMIELKDEELIDLVTDKFGKDDSLGETCDCKQCQARNKILQAVNEYPKLKKDRETILDNHERTLTLLKFEIDRLEQQNKKNQEIVDKILVHQTKCKERWCFCKSENFKEILGENK